MRRFYMRLARDLGAGSVARMLRIMPASELGEWVALYQLEHKEMQEARLKAEAQAKARSMKRAHSR